MEGALIGALIGGISGAALISPEYRYAGAVLGALPGFFAGLAVDSMGCDETRGPRPNQETTGRRRLASPLEAP